MIYVLEGCDCSGKSTLAKELSKQTGFEIVKGSSFEIAEKGTDAMFEYMMELLNRKDIIIDRFYPSNYVYGNLYNYPTMNSDQFVDLAFKTDVKAIMVYLYADEDTIIERMQDRGDDRINPTGVKAILHKYEEVFHSPSVSNKLLMQINTYHSDDIQYTASMLKEFGMLQETKMFYKG